jgi:DNA-binding beta-propeller fold protein YncE
MRPIAGALIIATLASACASTGAPERREVAYRVLSNTTLGGEGRWDLLAVDPRSHRVFISRSDHVDVFDGDGAKLLGTVSGTDGVHGIAVVPALGRAYSTNGKSNSLTEFDLASYARIRDIPLSGQSPDAILLEPHTGLLFAFDAHSNNVSVVDPAAGKETGTIAFEGNPELAVADGRGHLFVNIEDKAQLVEIDASRRAIVHTWTIEGCEGPTGLAMDLAHRRLFSACDNGVMAITDADSGRQVARVPIGEGPDGAAFDASGQDAFSPNGQSGTLTIIHEDDPEHFRVTQTLPTQTGARTIELDPSTHRLYLPTAHYGPKPEGEKRAPMLPGSFGLLVVSP